MLNTQIDSERRGDFAFLIAAHLKVVEILVDIRRVGQQTAVLALSAEKILAVQFGAEVGQQIRNVGHPLVVGWVCRLRASLVLAAVAQILIGEVAVEIQKRRHIALHLNLEAFGAHGAEVGVTRHRRNHICLIANHILKLIQKITRFSLNQSKLRGAVVEQASVQAVAAFGLQVRRGQD